VQDSAGFPYRNINIETFHPVIVAIFPYGRRIGCCAVASQHSLGDIFGGNLGIWLIVFLDEGVQNNIVGIHQLEKRILCQFGGIATNRFFKLPGEEYRLILVAPEYLLVRVMEYEQTDNADRYDHQQDNNNHPGKDVGSQTYHDLTFRKSCLETHPVEVLLHRIAPFRNCDFENPLKNFPHFRSLSIPPDKVILLYIRQNGID